MPSLTEAERRGARMLAVLLVLGTLTDLERARFPQWSHLESSPAASVAPPGAPRPAAGPAMGEAPHRPLDLNTATAPELDALPGIGPVLAARIVAHRREHGPFRSIEELLSVRGIGPRLLERLRPLLRPPPG